MRVEAVVVFNFPRELPPHPFPHGHKTGPRRYDFKPPFQGLSGRRPTRDPQRHLQKNRLKLASEAANRGSGVVGVISRKMYKWFAWFAVRALLRSGGPEEG